MMILKKIQLTDFRRFESLDFNFHKQLTIIVAKNSQGKSTILDAIAISLGTFIGAFDLGKAKHIVHSDARYHRMPDSNESEQKYPVIIDVSFTDPPIHAVRKLTGAKNKTTIKEASDLTDYGKALMQQVRDLKSVNLPVIAYYGSGRLWNIHKNMSRKSVLSESRSMGYEDCLSSASSYKQVQQWLIKATLAVIQERDLPIADNNNLGKQLDGIKTAVNEVLANEGWSNFHYSIRHEELIMFHKDHGLIPVSLLSDGVRAMVSLTADLAWRCTKLNPHLGKKAAKETQGIIMIDEVDMHLHPSWQQTIVGSLQAAFPKIQFVLTTHSPQVLSTVPAECIRILSDGEVHTASKGSKGAESSRLLKRIFGVDTRPQADENTQLLQAYEKLVYADQWDTEEAKQKRRQLDEIFAGEEPKLTELDLYIENRTWELDIEKDQ